MVIGSDRLFDNVHIGFLTYIINEVARLFVTGHKVESVKKKMEDSAEAYYTAVTKAQRAKPIKNQSETNDIQSVDNSLKANILNSGVSLPLMGTALNSLKVVVFDLYLFSIN